MRHPRDEKEEAAGRREKEEADGHKRKKRRQTDKKIMPKVVHRAAADFVRQQKILKNQP